MQDAGRRLLGGGRAGCLCRVSESAGTQERQAQDGSHNFLDSSYVLAAERVSAATLEAKMTYDVVVIGSGPGGYSTAVRAGQYGLKTALIEKQSRLGGTCLLVGCIPTKALLHTADVWDYFKHPEAQGIQCKDPQLNYGQVLERKNKIVTKHSKGIEFLMRKNKVDVIKGSARLLGGGRIEISGDRPETIETKNIILATGSEARMLPGLQPDPN